MKLSMLLEGLAVLSHSAILPEEIAGISYDSRKTKPGELFVAVTGYASDGHEYIAAAVHNGAAAVLCERIPAQDVPYILVADSRAALAVLGANRYGWPSRELTMVGVTGTNGKTTVTYLLKTVLEKTLGAKVGLIGTIENRIGDEVLPTERTTPESFELQALLRQMADAGCTHVVMEVSSHALVLHRVDCIDYRVGIFTNLTEDHLDFHKTMEAYSQAKALLFTKCNKGVLNADDAAYSLMNKACPCMTLSAKGKPADLRAEHIELGADHVAFDAVSAQGSTAVRLGIPGGFSVYNALSVFGAGLTLGIAPEKIAAALKEAKSVKGRVEVVPTPGKPYTVLIDYAHTPDALENVLCSVRGFCRGRLICVFGCGGDRDPIKRPIMGRIGVELSDLAVITSDNPRTEEPMKIIEDILVGAKQCGKPYQVVENRRKAIAWAMAHAQADDIIVLAGKGHETYQICGTEKTHLDEREEVAANL